MFKQSWSLARCLSTDKLLFSRSFHAACSLENMIKKLIVYGLVHNTKEKFVLKTRRMFSVHTKLEKLGKRNSHRSFSIWVSGKTRAGKSRDYRDVIVFTVLRFKMLSVHTKTQSLRFQISPGWRSFTELLSFRDGLVWMVGLTVEIRLRIVFKFFPRDMCGASVKNTRIYGHWKPNGLIE